MERTPDRKEAKGAARPEVQQMMFEAGQTTDVNEYVLRVRGLVKNEAPEFEQADLHALFWPLIYALYDNGLGPDKCADAILRAIFNGWHIGLMHDEEKPAPDSGD